MVMKGQIMFTPIPFFDLVSIWSSDIFLPQIGKFTDEFHAYIELF